VLDSLKFERLSFRGSHRASNVNERDLDIDLPSKNYDWFSTTVRLHSTTIISVPDRMRSPCRNERLRDTARDGRSPFERDHRGRSNLRSRGGLRNSSKNSDRSSSPPRRRQERPSSPYRYPKLYNDSRRWERSLSRRGYYQERSTSRPRDNRRRRNYWSSRSRVDSYRPPANEEHPVNASTAKASSMTESSLHQDVGYCANGLRCSMSPHEELESHEQAAAGDRTPVDNMVEVVEERSAYSERLADNERLTDNHKRPNSLSSLVNTTTANPDRTLQTPNIHDHHPAPYRPLPITTLPHPPQSSTLPPNDDSRLQEGALRQDNSPPKDALQRIIDGSRRRRRKRSKSRSRSERDPSKRRESRWSAGHATETAVRLPSMTSEDKSIPSLLPGLSQNVDIYTQSPCQLIKYDSGKDHVSDGIPIFRPEFHQVARSSEDMVQAMRMAMSDAQRDIPFFSSLDAALQRASSGFLSGPARVAVVGDVGQGKSFLIGSLLGDMGVVKEVSVSTLRF